MTEDGRLIRTDPVAMGVWKRLTAQFATWMTTSRPNPGPIKTVHISNCMFNLTTPARTNCTRSLSR